jgi:hypothetical protein
MPFKPMRSPRVYVPSKSAHNFDDAKQFGELVYLTEGVLNRIQINNVYRIVAAALAGADRNDYLLITGPTTVNAVAASILGYRFGQVNYLIFDGYAGRYVSKPIYIDKLEVENARPRDPAGAGACPADAPDRGS